jgi:uncharacterized protein with beta-barrel porin domain
MSTLGYVAIAGRVGEASGVRRLRPEGLRRRDALLGTVAAGALSLVFAGPALAGPNACVISGAVATCTGNQSAGIASGVDFNAPPVTTLDVNNLTQAIAPASGTDGINFTAIGAVTITSNTGAFGITTLGKNAQGIYAFSDNAVTLTSTGNITTAGENANGIAAFSLNDGVTVTSTGDITTATTGVDAAFGIVVISVDTATVTSSGNITTTDGSGIFARSIGGGAATVTSTGNITTAGISAWGIFARSYGVGAVAVTSSGNITTSDAHGIFARSYGTGAVTVTSTGNISTAGANANGIDASGNAGAVTVTSTGNITTTGSNAYGILARSYGTGAVTVTSTGNISTAGANANAIDASSNAGAVTVTSTGNIATQGIHAMGIFAFSNGVGAVTVTSTGNITTTGNNAYGIFAVSSGLGAGGVTVISTGDITTGGSGSFGIVAKSYGAGAVTVTSSGNITTGDATGIFAKSYGAGAVTVTSTGNITTAGDGVGILARSYGGGAVQVTSTGNITTTGSNAYGIFARSTGAVMVTSTGNITTQGPGVFGILAQGGGAVAVTSSGNITTSDANGIVAESYGAGAVRVTSTGNITTAGGNAIGIDASSRGGAVTVISSGNITTQGSAGAGILAQGTGAVTVTSTGNITVTGRNAYGIVAGSYGGGAVMVTSTGNIAVQGTHADGIVAAALTGAPITVTINSGAVSGGSGSGAGVVISGGANNTLTNFGTVTALSGLAILGDTGNNTVNNFGTVTGNVILGTGSNAFNTLAGGFFNAGATVNLGAGNLMTNAGTLSPGGAGVIQATALTGNLVQTAAGQLFTDIDIAGTASDRVNVSGTANLAGTVRVQVQNATLGPWQQTVLSAVGGTANNGLSLLASPALQAQLVFPNATDVVVKSAGINFLTPGLTGNQISLGNALNGAAQTAGLGGGVFNLLLNGVTSIPGYSLALNQLSGEAATGTQQVTFDAMNTFMGTMLDPFSRGTASTPGGVSGYASESEPSAYGSDGRKRTSAERDAYAMITKAPPVQIDEPRWNVWAAGFGGSQTTDGNAAVGSNGTTSSIAGAAVGADYVFSPNTTAGFAMAGGGTNYVIANGLGSGRSDLFQAGAYMRHTVGAAYIAGALAYGRQDITTNRTVTLAGLDQLQSSFNANAFSGRLEGGYRLVSPWMGVGITPYAAGQFTTFDLPAYAEQAIAGTNTFALAYGAKSVTDPRSELGFRTDKSWAMTGSMADAILTLRGRLAWAHDYDTDRSIAATFETLPGASFVVNGAAQAADKALTTAAAEVKWRNGFSVSGVFEGEFGGNVASYSGKGVVRYQW